MTSIDDANTGNNDRAADAIRTRRKKLLGDESAKPPRSVVNLDGIPEMLAARAQWVVWRWTWSTKQGCWTKVPYRSTGAGRAKSDSPATWGTLEKAHARYASSSTVDGVGYMLSDDDGIIAADLDSCRDPDDGSLTPEAAHFVETCATYTEVTPSGHGVRAYMIGAKPDDRCRNTTGDLDLEIYSGTGRYLTVTGHSATAAQHIADGTEALRQLWPIHFGAKPAKPTPPPTPEPPAEAPALSDDRIIELMLRARNAAKIRPLWDGDTSAYGGDDSRADSALVCHIAYYTKDAAQIDRLFRRSGLSRDKWDRDDYRSRTISHALDLVTEQYRPRARVRLGGASLAPSVGECGGSGECDRPTIILGTDEWRVNKEAGAALAKMPNVYTFGERIAYIGTQEEEDAEAVIRRPVGAPTVKLMTTHILRENLSRCARFERLVHKANGDQDQVPAAPPGYTVNALHDKGRWPGLPRLEAIVSHPVLLPCGDLLTESGFHRASGLMLWARRGLRIDAPPHPTAAQIRGALTILEDVVHDFPFQSSHHKAAWLAGLLTPLAWWAFEGPAPMTLIDANTRGAGKGLLADTIGFTVLGHRTPIMAYTSDRDELRKRITSLAAEGERLVLLDNLAGHVGNDVLDAALTTDTWKDRLLGINKIFNGPLHVCWYATGNNVQLGGDTSRRVSHVRLESDQERPELRDGFRHPQLRRHILDHRGEILSAAITLLRGYVAAGRPDQHLKAWGSFEGWSDLVRSAVVWAGVGDPGETREALQSESDTTTGALLSLLAELRELDPDRRGRTAAQMIEDAKERPDLRAAVEDLCGRLDSRPLGTRLRGLKRRIEGGHYLDRAGTDHKVARWAVFPAASFFRAGGHPPHPPHPPTPEGGVGGVGGVVQPKIKSGQQGTIIVESDANLDALWN